MASKAEIMQIAATLTAGCVANMPFSGQVAADGKLDAATQAKDLTEWEIFRVFYAGLVQADADESSWASPKTGASGHGALAGAGAVAVLQQLAQSTPSIATAIQGVIAQLTAPAGLPVGTSGS